MDYSDDIIKVMKERGFFKYHDGEFWYLCPCGKEVEVRAGDDGTIDEWSASCSCGWNFDGDAKGEWGRSR